MFNRVIARLDIKREHLIKGVQLEGLRKLGDPQLFAERYYKQGIDELLYIDLVASLYGRSKLTDIVSRASQNVFVPMTVGGGIRGVEDVEDLLRAGADKVAINTAAVSRPELIREIAQKFGSQCVVLSIEAKNITYGKWEAFTDCGRERSGIDVIEWVERGIELGAGEILLTSIDKEGGRNGFDIDLVQKVSSVSTVPIICSGGYSVPNDINLALSGGADAVAIADAFHYDRITVCELKEELNKIGLSVRESVII